MQSLLAILSLVLFAWVPDHGPLTPTTAESRLVRDQLEAVAQALSSGDAEGLSEHFDAVVELTLPGVNDILPRERAESVLSDFFAKQAPHSFARVHGGLSGGDQGNYVIGELRCSDATFRVFLYAGGDAGTRIQELRIE